MAKKALGETPVAPQRETKAKPKGKTEGPKTEGHGTQKLTPEKVNKRRTLFISDEFFTPVKEQAEAETRSRGVKVSPSEIIRESIAATPWFLEKWGAVKR